MAKITKKEEVKESPVESIETERREALVVLNGEVTEIPKTIVGYLYQYFKVSPEQVDLVFEKGFTMVYRKD